MKHARWILITLSVMGVTAGFVTIHYLASSSWPASSALSVASSHPSGIALASWPMAYASVGEITKDADLVVLGTVQGVVDVSEVSPGLITTQFSVNVDEVIKGSILTGAQSIIVQQTGGTVNTRTIEVEDDPLFKIGDQYVLFLREFEPGKYVVLSGPQGRFSVHAGLVTSLISIQSHDGVGLGTVSGKDLASFVNEIRNAK